MENSNWFLSRDLRVLDYQQNAISKVLDSIGQREITVLAASPSAGKTYMIINVIDNYIRNNPKAKVLVLAHGTRILRRQFYKNLMELNERKPFNFTFGCANSCEEYNSLSKKVNVIVTLPQTLARCKEIHKIDLLIVDEAHQFYFADENTKSKDITMVKKVITVGKPNKQILMTGTPSKFIYNKFHIIPVALNTVYDAGMISDFYVEIASSDYNFDYKDFNYDCELKSDIHFHNTNTKRTLDDLIFQIVKYLKSIRGNDYINLQPQWLPTLKSLKKTMIACKSRPQARQVQKYFESIGVNSVISISEDDVKSEEIQRFEEEEDILVLIVVGRGILGFNMETLVNVVDMTMSYNIDRIYQLLCRVARKHPNGDKKLFFKLAPQMLTDYYHHIMTAVCMLTEEEFFLKYNGKNFKDMEVIIKKAYEKRSKSTNNLVETRKKKQKKYMPVEMGDLPVFEFFKSIYHKKSELLSVYAKTTINDIRAEFLNKMPNEYWTKDRVISVAKECKTKSEFREKFAGAFNRAFVNGWLNECYSHLIISEGEFGYWQIKENVINAAKKCKTKNEFIKIYRGAHGAAEKNGWLNECYKYFISSNKPIGYWTKDRVISVAKECKTRQEFRENHISAYNTAVKNGWLNECYKYIKKTAHPNTFWTPKLVINEIKKHKSMYKFQKKCSGGYKAMIRLGLFEECKKYFKQPDNDLDGALVPV